MTCMSFDSNRLLAKNAGYADDKPVMEAVTLPREFAVSPAKWMTWVQPQRIAYLRSMYPQFQEEKDAAYETRLRQTEMQVTVKAVVSGGMPKRAQGVRPAGAGTDPYTGEDTTNEGTKTVSGAPMPSATSPLVTGLTSIFGVSADIIRTAMTNANSLERTRLELESRERLAALTQESQNSQLPQASRDAAASSAEMIRMFQSLMAQPSGMSTGTMVAIAAGAVVLVGGAVYMMSRSRRNPVITDARGRRKFVPAWRLAA